GVDGLPLGTVHIFNEASGVISGVSDAGAGLAISVEDPSAAYEEILIVNEGTLEGDVILGAGKTEVRLLDDSKTEGNILFGDGENTAQVSAGGSHGIGDGFMLIGGENGHNTLILFVQDDGEREGNIAGKTRNFQNVEIKDGNWTVDGGEMGSGNTVIRGGAVLVVPGGFHLQPGGRLGGNGTLRSDLVNEGTV